MAQVSLLKKGEGFMFLSMGVFAILAIAFFVVNGNFNLNAGAHRSTTKLGILRKDPNHTLACNKDLKTDFVIQDKNNPQICTPVVANASEADKLVGHSVQIDGEQVGTRFFATRFNDAGLPAPSSTPFPNFRK